MGDKESHSRNETRTHGAYRLCGFEQGRVLEIYSCVTTSESLPHFYGFLDNRSVRRKFAEHVGRKILGFPITGVGLSHTGLRRRSHVSLSLMKSYIARPCAA